MKTAFLIPGIMLSVSTAVSATFTVTTTNSTGPGSFRQAVAEANSSAGDDQITFNIPNGGPQKILVSGSPIELGDDSIEVMGGTQPGFSSVPIITLAADPENPPERLLDCGITLGGHTISGIRFEGVEGVAELVRLFTVGNSIVNCEFDGKGSSAVGAFVGGVALNTSIVGSSFENCGVGISQNVVGAATTIDSCQITNNQTGVGLDFPIGLQVLTQSATITNCVIANNANAGVRNHGGIVSRVLVRYNSIYNNGGLGIDNADTGPTANNNDLLADLLGDTLGVLEGIDVGVLDSKSVQPTGLIDDILGDGIIDLDELLGLDLDDLLGLGLLDDLLELIGADLGLLPEELLDNLLGNLGLLPEDVLELEGLLDLLNLLPEDLTNLEDLVSIPDLITGDLLDLDDLLLRLGVDINNLLASLFDQIGLDQILLGGSVNHPVITSVEWEGENLHIAGTIDTLPLMNVDIDFYLNPGEDAAAEAEGRTYIGTHTVDMGLTIDGAVPFEVVLPAPGSRAPQYLTATTNTNGVSLILTIPVGAGTSEFSTPAVTVPAGNFTPGENLAWTPSGMDSGPENPLDPNSPNDVDIEADADSVSVIVRPSVGRYRNAGWIADTGLKVSDVGHGNFLRGKFYVHASNELDAPMNTIPNFRIRLQNEMAVLTSANYDYAATGIGGTLHEPFYDTVNNIEEERTVGPSLRPSPLAVKPSLYRLDFDPIEVSASMDTSIFALFESYAQSNAANGTLTLTEISVGVYPKPTGGDQIFGWSNVPGIAAGTDAGGEKDINGGQFNADNLLVYGRRPDLDLPTDDVLQPLATVTETNSQGVLLDTNGVATNKVGIGLVDFFSTNNIEAPRVEADKIYSGRFLLSSDLPTSPQGGSKMQGDVYLSLKTGFQGTMTRTELIGANHYVTPNQPSADIAAQVLPGIGNAMTEKASDTVVPDGEVATWYNVQMSSPIDADIRQYANGDLGPFANEPGPGSLLPSARDIMPNVAVLQSPLEINVNNEYNLPWSAPNRGKVRVLAVEVWSHNQIDDGGYNF